SKNRWLHLAFVVDNKERKVGLFVNGRLMKEFTQIEVPLKGNHFKLGKGYGKRFWKGSIADLRISDGVRYERDFEPEKVATSKDKQTIFLLDEKTGL
ncbi:MAG: LamG-like jellyroll fold domain-containing protein, partial [Thermodesulfobacteriota bacterium]